jgi:hypothetical protein
MMMMMMLLCSSWRSCSWCKWIQAPLQQEIYYKKKLWQKSRPKNPNFLAIKCSYKPVTQITLLRSRVQPKFQQIANGTKMNSESTQP